MRHGKWRLALLLMTGVVLILLFASGMTGFIAYKNAKRTILNNYLQNYSQSFGRLNHQLSGAVNDVVKMAAALNNNTDLIGELSLVRAANSESEKAQHRRNVKKTLRTAVGYEPYIDNIGVYMQDEQILMYDISSEGYFDEVIGEPWFRAICSGESIDAVIPDYCLKNRQSPFRQPYYQTKFIYAHALNNTRVAKNSGVLLFSFEHEYLRGLLNQVENTDNAAVFLMNDRWEIICENDLAIEQFDIPFPDELRLMQAGEMLTTAKGRLMLIRNNNESYPWELVALIPENRMYSEMQKMRLSIYLGLLLIVIITFPLVLIFNSLITRHFSRLMYAMQRAGHGDLRRSALRSPILELDAIAVQYDDMIAQISDLIERNRRMEAEKKNAEMDALRTQINPHFLYNTLDSIRWMALMQKAPQVEKMVSLLGKLLRMTTRQCGSFIRVNEEMEQVALYAEIMRFRYNGMIDISFEIESGLESAGTLGLLLQPIVENCFIHGFKNMKIAGKITVQAHSEDGKLVFVVSDNGCGMEMLKDALPNTFVRDGAHMYTGIGIGNTDDRLRMTYGEGYGVTVQSVEGSGTVVKLTQPLVMFEQGEFTNDSGNDR